MADLWVPQAGPQELAVECAGSIDEVLFGGARGGGKTNWLLGDFVQDIGQGALWTGILFRRSIPELDEVVRQSQQIYPTYGGEYKVGRNEWWFPAGARLRLRHMEDINDYMKYHGHQYSWVGFDELGQWPDLTAYRAMISTVRGAARRKRIRATANPGGVGHLALKGYFDISRHPQGRVPIRNARTGMTRMYIPAKIQDNKILLAADPDYEQRLYASGDDELVRAWVDGDWDAIVGSYFSMWDHTQHVVAPFTIPLHWPLFMGLDYGETNPTAAVLAAVTPDDEVVLVDYYSVPHRGAADHARALGAWLDACPYTGKRRPSMILADPSMWTKRRTDEAALARSPYDTFVKHNLFPVKANNDRINGWRILMDALRHQRLRLFNGSMDGLIEAIPTMQRDPTNPEDMLKGGDDHGLDALRYLMGHVYKATPVHTPTRPQFTGTRALEQLHSVRL